MVKNTNYQNLQSVVINTILIYTIILHLYLMSDFADIINGIVYSELQCEPDFVLSFYWAKQIMAKSVKKNCFTYKNKTGQAKL